MSAKVQSLDCAQNDIGSFDYPIMKTFGVKFSSKSKSTLKNHLCSFKLQMTIVGKLEKHTCTVIWDILYIVGKELHHTNARLYYY